ncbi:hypothetical protein [Promicromonospora soli]|uniref:Peptidase inhibitor family I36 n=1 Tax=Promicromonospora soli TaxID=2035533 RepID=A0A919FPD2_9MICO|nr:hypothetical protein [Promicromonospora soli]GHH69556.1 hypothetical protein GCM10017772_14700 [Promicromonospora soli]
MRTRKRAGAAAIVLGLALALGIAAPAHAVEEYDRADSTSPSGTMELCIGTPTPGGGGCFKKYGDKIFVHDGEPDGWSVYILWSNNLRDSNYEWQPYRTGRCEFYGGYPNWGECNKDFYEHSTSPNAKGGKGSRVRIKACVNRTNLTDLCSEWSGYAYNDK